MKKSEFEYKSIEVIVQKKEGVPYEVIETEQIIENVLEKLNELGRDSDGKGGWSLTPFHLNHHTGKGAVKYFLILERRK